ncbi:MAG: ribosomal RNA small subunit methyltransferase A [Dehalococcoidia bacterium]|nr:ribosomal RNA small subunit methyltransferase A [Dehalococcoidia bacterium]
MPRTRSPGPRPRKALGQHFLRDSGVLADIASALRVPQGGVVVEIGPGTGQLTAALLDLRHHVIAIEVEDRMIRHLGRRFPGEGRLRLVEGDARDIDLAAIVPAGMPFVVVGNLPYFAANPIIRHLLEGEPKPTELVVMVQREVARELTAPVGDFSLLTISVLVYAASEHLFDVPPEAFDPPPNVWSSVVRLTLRQQPLVPSRRREAFFTLVSRTFRNPRKQIHNTLAQAVALPKELTDRALADAGIDPARRAETLTVDEWLALLDACEEHLVRR